MGIVWDLEILMMIPISNIIEYPNDFDDNYFENHLFKIIRNYLNIEIDVYEIMNHVGYNVGRRENGSVSIYYASDSFDKYILFDTYRGATDQLDIINIGFSCPRNMGVELRKLVRNYYDETCEYNIYYCEGTNPIGYKYKNDFKLFEALNKEKKFKTIEGKRYLFYKEGNMLLQLEG